MVAGRKPDNNGGIHVQLQNHIQSVLVIVQYIATGTLDKWSVNDFPLGHSHLDR
jgi:hypothetical protein